MWKSAVLALIVFFLVFCAVTEAGSSASDVADDSWVKKEPMPTARIHLGVAAMEGKIYAIGGGTGDVDAYLSLNEMYDPAKDTWTAKVAMPTPRKGFGVAVFQNKIYVMGGQTGFNWSGSGNPVLCSTIEVYDPTTDSWVNKTSMPMQRAWFTANIVNGKIYLIGGDVIDDNGRTQQIVGLNQVYDPSTETWKTLKPIPNAVSYAASAAVDGRIYVFGGSGTTNKTQVYDTSNNSWSIGAPIPLSSPSYGLVGAAAAATTGAEAPKRIYLMGGGSIIPTSVNFVYAPIADNWTIGASMPSVRNGLGVAVVNDQLYAIGGGSDWPGAGWYVDQSGSANERYTPTDYRTVISPSLSETETPKASEKEENTFMCITILGVLVALAIVGLIVYFKRRPDR